MPEDSTNWRGLAIAMRPLFYLIALAFAAAPIPSIAQSPISRIERILLKSIMAQGHVNLRGRQIELTPTGDGMISTTKRVVRRSDGRSLSVCLDSHERPVSVHMDDGKTSRDFDVQRNMITTSHSMPTVQSQAEARRIARRILGSYKVTLVRDDYSASRPCYVLELEPRDPHSHSLTVWIDKESGATLWRRESFRKGDNTISLTIFTDVSFPLEIKDSELQYRFPRKARVVSLSLSPRYNDLASLKPKAGFPLFQPICMPFGFEFESCEMVRFNRIPTACLRYSDGVSVINIFEARSQDPVPPSRASITGKELPRGEAFARVQLDWTMCVVMGARTLDGTIAIARSLDVEGARSKLINLARSFNVSENVVLSMRNQGCGLDCIAAILEIAAQTGRSAQSIFWMHRQGWPWPSLARQLKADVRLVSNRVKQYQSR